MTRTTLRSLPPLSIYIHIPWCQHKCPYCDFSSHATSFPLPEDIFLSRFSEEIQRKKSWGQERKIQSLYFGGGTPSLLQTSTLQKMLSLCRTHFDCDETIEISIEANPKTISRDQLLRLQALGIHRFSFGIQSFQDKKLQTLGRIHSSDDARILLSFASKESLLFNVDLMYGLPNQTIQDAENDLKEAFSFEPQHLSWYQLTLEPQTPFGKNPPLLPDETCLQEMEQTGYAFLEKGGYHRYEVSAYAKNGAFCRHNLNYWSFGDYIGLGPYAHGKVTFENDNILRTINPNLTHYLQTSDASMITKPPLQEHEKILEFMLNTCRLYQKIPYEWFESRTGLSLSVLTSTLAQAEKEGFLKTFPDGFQTTEKGQRFYEDLLLLF